MNNQFKNYELEILGVLLSEHYSREELKKILDQAISTKTNYDGYGFDVVVVNPAIGVERRVFNTPLIVAELGDEQASFVVFLEDNELTLETFPIDGENLSENFREGDVKILKT